MIVKISISKGNLDKNIILDTKDNEIFNLIFNTKEEATNVGHISIPYKDINGKCGFILTDNIFSIDIINESLTKDFIPNPLEKKHDIDEAFFV